MFIIVYVYMFVETFYFEQPSPQVAFHRPKSRRCPGLRGLKDSELQTAESAERSEVETVALFGIHLEGIRHGCWHMVASGGIWWHRGPVRR